MSAEEQELGPVDIVVIGFPADAPRTGEAVPHFIDLVDRGVVRVLDVLLIEKDSDGNVAELEISGLDRAGFTEMREFAGARTGMLGDEDASVAGAVLEPGEAALLICFENTWAAPFASAIRRNGGRMLDFQRIPADEVIASIEALDAV